MKIGIPRESLSGETRVACTPATVALLGKLGFETVVESGAGLAASLDDAAYQTAGATVADKAAVWACPLIYKVNAPSEGELPLLNEGQTIVSFLWPRQNEALVEALRAKKVNALAMDMVPRISRAQALDALSSMANISGYRAVIEAANAFGRFFTGQITAAGKVPPAQVLVIGAGVAGLAAIGTANSLGAVVRAFDTRLEVAEQIESMGGKFLKLDFPQESGGSGDGYAKVMSDEFIAAEMKLFAEQAKEVDIIITTAAIPGKPAPKLITKEMVESMKSGSVIVDLAAATGGNCELTRPGELSVTGNGVKIIGYTDMANRLAGQSSQLYATNLVNLTKLLSPNKDGEITLDFEDVIIRNMTVTRDGEITFPPPPIQVSAQPQQTPSEKAAPAAKPEPKPVPLWKKLAPAVIAAVLVLWVGAVAPAAFLNHFIVFVLACVIGYYVVWNVSHSLHTPLMSVTNAISGIIVVGALLQIGQGNGFVSLLSFVAILIAGINIFGGFAVTRRMLNMFKKG
ncbi:TPA: Re/Si-specific NAD(P)(+) transhydrogenase subunit alpha [Neisseria meningitidis]|uniref:Re/Si-specific NAD(P)(+) transhydrogenase subunit alpha n=1 Tax=Neisseria meningitidis TaxID=487 RepID=UPI000C328B0A|nr:Re/Si-specific NAD(P)(+) transhydrogenase subunit alpha [Neisseria meningitidis]MBG8754844.1 Re/Si-specific NAD(P)(+) transhydrogenase subunit alpha [Neisseria meningitidis]MBG8770849.1 Re/Si-specific NAD(P)(+) transhydrogenase subunit alpha [Neisseria meningitidis]MBG8990777.1 Re/Si-specific NAD(P)(+) transhydrogenase subunit alpha [Neisseria meningitidis]MBG8993597.1 Re/Si-specific NAD(P)(+) transhydrogenase subunit alpha [Neisseria meningitidis]MBG8996752.1 Re/Si-specific NAD(P)(+) trans